MALPNANKNFKKLLKYLKVFTISGKMLVVGK